MRTAQLGKFKVKMVLGKYLAKNKIKYYFSIKRKLLQIFTKFAFKRVR